MSTLYSMLPVSRHSLIQHNLIPAQYIAGVYALCFSSSICSPPLSNNFFSIRNSPNVYVTAQGNSPAHRYVVVVHVLFLNAKLIWNINKPFLFNFHGSSRSICAIIFQNKSPPSSPISSSGVLPLSLGSVHASRVGAATQLRLLHHRAV